MGHWFVRRLLKTRSHAAFTSSGDIFLISSGVRGGISWGCFGMTAAFAPRYAKRERPVRGVTALADRYG